MSRNSNRKLKTNPKSSNNAQFPLSNNIAKQDNCEQMLEYANFIFEQVKFQQEARDNWFGHYLTIVGSVVGFATIVFAVFSQSWNIKILQITLGCIFILTGLLGILFYFLFLAQRVNYKLHYRVLNELQYEFVARFLKEQYSFYYPSKRTPFKKLKFGADYIASFIQRLLVSFCTMIGIALLLLGFGKTICQVISVGAIAFIVVLVLLKIIHRMYEKTI